MKLSKWVDNLKDLFKQETRNRLLKRNGEADGRPWSVTPQSGDAAPANQQTL